jgi:HAD superfamily hydrolase (TIGR01509 family)
MVATAALIFDLDGVLVDSELLIGREVSAALRPFNIDLPPGDYHPRFHYVRLERMAETISAEHGVALPDDFVPQLRKRLNVAYASDLEAVPGAEAMLRAVTHPVAVASGSVPEGIDLKLRRTGLYDFFAPHIYSVFDVGAARKPAPDVFLYTAEKLGLAPADCIVVEDASAGVTAGIAAGMRVLGFTGGGHAYPGLSEKLKSAGAAEVFDDLADLVTLI